MQNQPANLTVINKRFNIQKGRISASYLAALDAALLQGGGADLAAVAPLEWSLENFLTRRLAANGYQEDQAGSMAAAVVGRIRGVRDALEQGLVNPRTALGRQQLASVGEELGALYTTMGIE